MIRVLYVDDEESLLELAKEFLESNNDLVIEISSNATEGLRRISEGGIDVVVSDYAMPDMDGLAFLRALRRSGSDVPFILFTGKGREEVVIQALNGGADSYLQKGGHPAPQFAELAHRIIKAAERHRAVRALTQSEARLRRAEEIAGFGHWELHLDDRTMHSSSGAKIIYGTNEGLNTFDEVKDIPLPEFRPLLDRALKNLMEKGEVYDIEFKVRRPSDGRIVDVHSKAEYDPINRIVFGVLQDITERKRAQTEISIKNEELEASYAQMSSAEEELIAAQHKLSVAMDLAKLVYWEIDLAKGIFIFNDNFYSLYSTTADREGGHTMRIEEYSDRFVHPEDRSFVTKVIEQNITSQTKVHQIEHRIVRRDGQVRDVVVCIEMEMGNNGFPLYIYGANQDITDRKRAEVALERANRKLGLLNSITRHDIMNQMTILRGNLELLRIKSADPEAQSRMERIDRASQIILDQIRFTKEYQDMGSSAPQWQNLARLLRDGQAAREIKDLRISDRAARLSLYADPMLPKVFSNLIENTVRYGGKPSSVRIDCEPADNGMELVYQDAGPGIPQADKEKIFEKGFGKGTGLGLFLSREILAITGMAIRENGTEGHGARFVISVPVQMFRMN
jgi:PAS domain S-box-containing protein